VLAGLPGALTKLWGGGFVPPPATSKSSTPSFRLVCGSSAGEIELQANLVRIEMTGPSQKRIVSLMTPNPTEPGAPMGWVPDSKVPVADGPRRTRDLPDVHHRTLIGRPDSGRGTISTIADFLNRVASLQAADHLFEKVEVELNLGCNRRCTYCNLSADRRENYTTSTSKVMDWDLFVLLIRQLADIPFRGVLCWHFFAEPLLNRLLAEYTSYATNALQSARTILYTNGDYLTPARYRELTAAGVSLFFVTRHDNRIPDFLAPVLSESNVVLDTRYDMKLNNRAGFLGPPTDPRVRSLPCIYTAESVVVTIDGQVLPCSCDFRALNPFGNIRTAHIADIYTSEECLRFRRDLLEGKREAYSLCRDCDVYSEVLGAPSAAESQRLVDQSTVSEMRGRTVPNGSD
jgi:radical SAM protein with 4Fe4S-binding SPASM domain